MKRRIYLVILIILIGMITSCSSQGLIPEQALWGQWTFRQNYGGDYSYCTDLEFTSEKKLVRTGTGFSDEDSVDYVIIAPGRMKVTFNEESQVFNYEIEDDTLRIIFSEGYIEYSKNHEVISQEEDTTEAIIKTPSMTPSIQTIDNSPTATLFVSTITSTVAVVPPTSTPEEEIEITSDLNYVTPTPVLYFPLLNCASSHIRVGDYAFISYEGGKNFLRSTPDTHPTSNIIGDILQGDVIEILEGPECNYGWILWKVRTTRDEVGWTAETDGDEFWIFPVSTRQLCSGALPTRLIAGEKAKVMEEPPLSNLVRTAPDQGAEVIGRILPGNEMLVLEGPACGDKTNWWKVESLSGNLIGWTREGDASDYFLVPIP